MNKVCAIILAGGKGKRMEQNISKQFIEVNKKPILYYTLNSFKKCECIDEIVLVLPKDEIEYCKKEVLGKYSIYVDKIVEGGEERQDSVYNGLNALEECDVVLIHDGARPFVSQKIIEDGIKYAKIYKAAAPGIMPKDTIKVKTEDGFSKETPDRKTLCAVQTPQCFNYKLIKECHEKIKKEHVTVTDDTMVVEKFHNKVYLFDGEYINIKITTPEDLALAKWLCK